jgi:hypothetical protein
MFMANKTKSFLLMTDHIERFPANKSGVATLPTAPASNGDVAAIDELRALYNKIRAELAKVIIGQEEVVERLF